MKLQSDRWRTADSTFRRHHEIPQTNCSWQKFLLRFILIFWNKFSIGPEKRNSNCFSPSLLTVRNKTFKTVHKVYFWHCFDVILHVYSLSKQDLQSRKSSKVDSANSSYARILLTLNYLHLLWLTWLVIPFSLSTIRLILMP